MSTMVAINPPPPLVKTVTPLACLLDCSDMSSRASAEKDSRKRGRSDSLSDSSSDSGPLEYPKCMHLFFTEPPDLEVRYAVVFMQNATGQWCCTICRGKQRYWPLSKARRHEISGMHTSRLRELDRPEPWQFSDPFDEDVHAQSSYNQPTGSSKIPPKNDLNDNSDEDDELDNEARGLSSPTGSEPRDAHAGPTDADENDAMEYSVGTIHGPSLPGDDPEQIYDNWGGELAEWGGEPEGFDIEDTGSDDSTGSEGMLESESEGWVVPGGTRELDDNRHVRDASRHAPNESEPAEQCSSPAGTEYERLSSPVQAFDNDEEPGEEHREQEETSHR